MLEKLAKESLKSRIVGPFKKKIKNLVCSPLGLVPKAVNGKFRLIHDLSYPKGNSVNSLIPPENSEVKYDCIDNVIKLVKYFGRIHILEKLMWRMHLEILIFTHLTIIYWFYLEWVLLL